MRLGLVVRSDSPGTEDVAQAVVAAADANGLDSIVIDEQSDEPLGPCDVVVAIGGDGTVLAASRHAIADDAVVIGINTGRVGFLADAEPHEAEQIVSLIAGGEWNETSRMTVGAAIDDGPFHIGLNDVVIEKVVSQRLVSLEVFVDGERFLTYRADGLVFATPTGSTAYNLSAGGPIVDPRVDTVLVTPVAPYSQFRRTLALPPSVELDCKITHDRPAGVNVDSRDLGVVQPGQVVRIRAGQSRVRFIDIGKRSYMQTVKQKLRLYEGLDGASL